MVYYFFYSFFSPPGPDRYARMTPPLSWKEMRQGVVYLQCGDSDNPSVEGRICFKAFAGVTVIS